MHSSDATKAVGVRRVSLRGAAAAVPVPSDTSSEAQFGPSFRTLGAVLPIPASDSEPVARPLFSKSVQQISGVEAGSVASIQPPEAEPITRPDSFTDLDQLPPGVDVATQGAPLPWVLSSADIGPDDIEVGRRLGKGSTADVRTCYFRGGRYALRALRKGVPGVEGGLWKEACLMAELDHPRILRLHFAVVGGGTHLPRYLLLECCGGGSLSAMVSALGGKLRPKAAVRVVRMVGEGLEYLHSRGVVHGDVAQSNVLFDANAHAKLADFGTAASAGDAFEGTPIYMSPQRLRGAALSPSDDIYAAGAVAAELIPPIVLHGTRVGCSPLEREGQRQRALAANPGFDGVMRAMSLTVPARPAAKGLVEACAKLEAGEESAEWGVVREYLRARDVAVGRRDARRGYGPPNWQARAHAAEADLVLQTETAHRQQVLTEELDSRLALSHLLREDPPTPRLHLLPPQILGGGEVVVVDYPSLVDARDPPPP
eukprot:Hpha_TRINITY_DN33946_c0_g1::TRINITY_DN33946_c0_g1_i1::g.69519::m.69519